MLFHGTHTNKWDDVFQGIWQSDWHKGTTQYFLWSLKKKLVLCVVVGLENSQYLKYF